MTNDSFRFLFCVPTTQLSGGVKIVFALSDALVDAGHSVDLFSWAGSPEWYSPKAALLSEKDIPDVDMSRYDFVVVSNAMLIPMVLPSISSASCVFLALDYEAFHHSNASTYQSFLAENSTFQKLYGLPVPIIATSRPIQRLVEERIGKSAYVMRIPIDTKVFVAQPARPSSDRRRVLLVGNYLMPYKGMRDGIVALEALAKDTPVELVIITQEERGRKLFDSLPFPVEIHFCADEAAVPTIIGSCDVYCCTSWYEGLGLPALEAFACGVPVVSTRTLGVDDYAEDGVNLLLANPNDPEDLAKQLRRVLGDSVLRESLVAGGFRTIVSRPTWPESARVFLDAIEEIRRLYEGAGAVDSTRMQGLLDELELTGSYTPIEIYREFLDLDRALRNVSLELEKAGRDDLHLDELRGIRDRLGRRLENEGAQYYQPFKARFDFAQLLLGLLEENHVGHARTLIKRDLYPIPALNAAAHAETRYPK